MEKMFGLFITYFKFIPSGVLASLLFYSPVSLAQTCGNMDGRSFTNAISQIEITASSTAMNLRDLVGTNKDKGLQTWEDAKKAVGALQPCNPEQDLYKTMTLEWLTWLHQWEVCYYTYYIKLATGEAGVGQWLDCITPVNQEITSIARARSAQLGLALETPCNDAFCTVDHPQQVIAAEVYEKAREAGRLIEKVISWGQLKKLLLNDGLAFSFNPKWPGEVAAKLSIKSVQKGGNFIVTNVAEATSRTVANATTQLKVALVPNGEKALNGPYSQELSMTLTFRPDNNLAPETSTYTFHLKSSP